MAWIAQSNGAKTYYRTNTVANGLNENDVNILDFEYWFPVDNMQSGGYAATGTPDTIEFMHLWLLQTLIGIMKHIPMKELNTVVTTLVKQVYVVLERTNCLFLAVGSSTEGGFSGYQVTEKMVPEAVTNISEFQSRWK